MIFKALLWLIKRHWVLFSTIQLVIVFQVSCELAIPYILKELIAHPEHIGFYVGIMIALAFGGLVAGVGNWTLTAYLMSKFGRFLRNQTYQKTHEFSLSDLQHFSAASLVRRLSTNLKQLMDLLGFFSRIVVRSSLMVLGGVILTVLVVSQPSSNELKFTSSNLAVVISLVIGFLLLGLGFLVFTSLAAQKRFEKVQKFYDQYVNHIQESAVGIRFIKATNLEPYQLTKTQKLTQIIKVNNIKGLILEDSVTPIMTFLLTAMNLAVLWYGSHVFAIAQISSLTQILSYVILGLLLMSFFLSNIGKANVAAARVYDVLDYQVPPKLSNACEEPINQADLVLDNVSFAYAANEHLVLSNLNLKIPFNSTLGIIGKIGSGKSTLAHLLANLYQPTSGMVLVNQLNFQHLSEQHFNHLVGLVPQKNNLFSGTIKSNLMFADNTASEAAMWSVLKTACISDFVTNTTEGLNYPINQRGNNLSGGQKQRLCIARALLKKPQILIFDDATSALDGKTEQQLLTNLHNLAYQCTKIFISQKISTLVTLDQILVLDQGQIVGLGTHEQLMTNCALYQQLYQAQMGG